MKTQFNRILILLATLLMPLCLMAQIKEVKGVVYDEEGEPVPGATVTVTGTKNIVVTDIDGNFLLKNLGPEAKTITVTYVGMEPATEKIAPDMTIRLHTRSEMMDEVVVVAFGKQKREAFTGSASVVKGSDLSMRQANNPISALEGKVPGMTMLSSNNPTSEGTSEIRIRGISSINAKSNPLIVVDGQPYSGALRDINPADVDNISVLKDAASNALYGARGANGVIMITTKSSQKGNTRVNVDMKWGANTDALIDYDVIDSPAEYYEAYYRAMFNYNRRALGMSAAAAHLNANATMCGTSSDNGGLGYIVYAVPAGQTLIGSNGRLNPNATLGNRVYNKGQVYTLYPDSWRDHGIRTGFRQEYNLSLSGGNDKISTYFSLGYLENNGISYGSDLKRYTARLKADYQAYPWLKVGANANYSHADYNNMNNAFLTVHSIAPIYPLYLRDGYGNVMEDARGPMYDYGDGTLGFVRGAADKESNTIQNDRLNKSKTGTNSFQMNGYANFYIPWGFRVTINGGVHLYEYLTNYAYNPYYPYYNKLGGSVSTSNYRRLSTNWQQLINWERQFGKHNVEVLIGHEYNRQATTNLSGSKTQIAIFEDNIELDGAIIDGALTGNKTLYNVEGFFGRAQYDFDSRVFLSASFRRDGSSRFHPKHR